MMTNDRLTKNEARIIAEEAMVQWLGNDTKKTAGAVLNSYCYSGNNCYIFYRRKDIEPIPGNITATCAVAVTLSGKVSGIPDYRPDEKKMQENHEFADMLVGKGRL